jgi:hypothetical protein
MKILLAATAALTLCVGSAYADTLRPQVGKPLLAAEKALNAHAYDKATSELDRAAAVPDKTPDEILDIDKMRAAIDASRGDYAASAKDYAALIATGQLSGAEVTTMAGGEASADYQIGDYAATAATIKHYLPNDAQFHPLLLQSYLKLNDCAALDAAVLPAHMAHTPSQPELQMVAYCYATAKNIPAYTGAMIALVKYDPSPDNWKNLLAVMASNPAFADELSLDFLRLKLAVGAPLSEPDLMNETEDALQIGLPNAAATFFAAGYKAGVLGTGPDADRQTRLDALIKERQAAATPAAAQQDLATKDYGSVFAAGFNEVDGGNADGLSLMTQAIQSGQLTHVPQAELEMGIAYHEAGQQPNALATWKSIPATDPSGQLAQLWALVR